MADYKSMYYHITGRVAGAVESLEAATATLKATIQTTNLALQESVEVLVSLMESLKSAQQATEEMFMDTDDEEGSDHGQT